MLYCKVVYKDVLLGTHSFPYLSLILSTIKLNDKTVNQNVSLYNNDV